MHEQAAHHGLRGLLGPKEFNRLMEFVRRGYGFENARQAEEHVARIAEKLNAGEALSSKDGFHWRKVVDAVRAWLARHGISVSEKNLEAVLRQSLRAMARGGERSREAGQMQEAAAFSASISPHKEWVEGVDRLLAGTMRRAEILQAGRTPDVFRALGAPDLPMVMTQDAARKVLEEKHMLPVELVKQLPEQLTRPVAVFDSATQAGELVALTEFLHAGKPVIAAIHLDSRANSVQVNRIASFHDRKGGNAWLADQLQRNTRYYDKTKLLALVRRAGLQLPGKPSNARSIVKILTDLDVVNAQPDTNFSLRKDTDGRMQEAAAFSAKKGRGGAHEFVAAPHGGLDFGIITPETAKRAGMEPGPIRLQRGFHRSSPVDPYGSGFGATHIWEAHKSDLEDHGYNSAEQFVDDVLRRAGEIHSNPPRKDKSGGIFKKYAFVVQGEKAARLVVELKKKNGFYTVTTAFPMPKHEAAVKYTDRTRLALIPVRASAAGSASPRLERPASYSGTTGETGSGRRVQQENTSSAADVNGPVHFSLRKDTDARMQEAAAFSAKEGARHTVESATMPREAFTFGEARAKAREFLGKPLTNDASGMTATVSSTNVGKMLSDSAVRKSVSPEAQSYAVANLDKLFKHAEPLETHPDRDGSPRLKAIHRFYAPMQFKGDMLVAKLTVKEFAEPREGNKIYSVEAMELEKPAGNWAASISGQGQRMSAPQAGFMEKVRALAAQVKGKPDANFSLRRDADEALPKLARQSGMTFLSRALGSPEYWKHPVLKKLFTIFRNRHDRAHEILHAALDDGQGGTVMDGWKALGKEKQKMLSDVIDTADVREIKPHLVEEWMAEQNIPEDVRAVWRAMRKSYDRMLEERVKPFEDMLARGVNPDVTYVDSTGKTVTMSLREAVNEMGSMAGFYAPRQRPTGDLAVLAHRQGPGGEMEYARHHAEWGHQAKKIAFDLRKQGWTVTSIERVNKLGESTQQAIARLGEVASVVREAAQNLKGVPDEARQALMTQLVEDLSVEIKARGFRSSAIRRTGRHGRVVEAPIRRAHDPPLPAGLLLGDSGNSRAMLSACWRVTATSCRETSCSSGVFVWASASILAICAAKASSWGRRGSYPLASMASRRAARSSS
jgi:hypothetical protein